MPSHLHDSTLSHMRAQDGRVRMTAVTQATRSGNPVAGAGFASALASSLKKAAGTAIDVLNPLQHIPGVGHLYRAVTGDEISPLARLAGGGLIAGPVGIAAAGGIMAAEKLLPAAGTAVIAAVASRGRDTSEAQSPAPVLEQAPTGPGPLQAGPSPFASPFIPPRPEDLSPSAQAALIRSFEGTTAEQLRASFAAQSDVPGAQKDTPQQDEAQPSATSAAQATAQYNSALAMMAANLQKYQAQTPSQ